jgi:hypothetical protein
MTRKQPMLRPEPAQRKPPTPDPILAIPRQTSSAIAERIRIREELRDARAVTIKGRRPKY